MPAHLIQAMPMLVLGLAGLAGIGVLWLRDRRAGGQRAAAAGRDLAVALALAACWAGIWVLYATYTWTAAPGLSTLQAARFYVPALGAILLLGAWLLVRVPRRQPLAAVTTLAVVAALFGLGGWAFHDIYQHPFGSQLVVVPGPGGTVELEPGPGAMTGGPGTVAPGGSGRAVWQGKCPDSMMALPGDRLQKATANSECRRARSAVLAPALVSRHGRLCRPRAQRRGSAVDAVPG
jgi:hypothetical protein